MTVELLALANAMGHASFYRRSIENEYVDISLGYKIFYGSCLGSSLLSLEWKLLGSMETKKCEVIFKKGEVICIDKEKESAFSM